MVQLEVGGDTVSPPTNEDLSPISQKEMQEKFSEFSLNKIADLNEEEKVRMYESQLKKAIDIQLNITQDFNTDSTERQPPVGHTLRKKLKHLRR